MFEAFIFTVIIFLALIGISEVLHFLAGFILKPRVKPAKSLIVRLDSACAEQQILHALFEIKWSGERYADKVVFLTDGLENSAARRLAREYKSSVAEFKNGVFYGNKQND